MFAPGNQSRFSNILFQISNPSSSLLFIYAIRASVGAVIGLFVVTSGLNMGQTAVQNYTDPFAVYDAVMPGQPAAALSDYPCRSTDQLMRYGYGIVSNTVVCDIFPQNDSFHLVEIETRDEMVYRVTFYADSLRLGDLALHWGRFHRPSQKVSHRYLLSWLTNDYFVQISTGRVDYQDTVRLVTVTRND